MDLCQVTNGLRAGVEQAEGVDHLHPGRGGKGKQLVDSGEAIAACARRDQLIHRAPADPEVAQAQVAEEGDERVVGRVEQVAAQAGVAGS